MVHQVHQVSQAPSAHKAEARHPRCWACDALPWITDSRVKLCQTVWWLVSGDLGLNMVSDLWYPHSE